MTSATADARMTEMFAVARALEPSDAEVAAVIARATPALARSPRQRSSLPLRRLASIAAMAAIVIGGGGYLAAPPIQAAIDDVAGTFRGWFEGDPAQAPGRALRIDEGAPSYMRDPSFSIESRVIAEADGYRLVVTLTKGGYLDFDLGNTGVGIGFPAGNYLKGKSLIVLGPGSAQHADEHGHIPLFGLTSRSVTSVELRYADGEPLIVKANGGFVLLAEPGRRPVEVVARDSNGTQLGSQLVDMSAHRGPRIDWAHYGPAAPRRHPACENHDQVPASTCPGG